LEERGVVVDVRVESRELRVVSLANLSGLPKFEAHAMRRLALKEVKR
jgi:hypothetical protein